jgi:hypothetical protein
MAPISGKYAAGGKAVAVVLSGANGDFTKFMTAQAE